MWDSGWRRRTVDVLRRVPQLLGAGAWGHHTWFRVTRVTGEVKCSLPCCTRARVYTPTTLPVVVTGMGSLRLLFLTLDVQTELGVNQKTLFFFPPLEWH